MKICVIGTGYVGLVAAAIFADKGHKVIGVDKDQEKIGKILQGSMPIYEPGLDKVVLDNVKQGRLKFSTSTSEGVKESEIVFVCVGTPEGDMGAADLSAVFTAAKEIANNITGYKIVVIKSTVPAGTNERVEQILKENIPEGATFDIVSNPEFLREGVAVEDMRNTDRTVIGTKSKKALKIMRELYKDFNAPIVECDPKSAEIIKYAANSFLTTKISFINEISELCERVDANAQIVAEGIGLDKRIGKAFFKPVGVGFGGSCFGKDPIALYRTCMDNAYEFKILRSVIEVNERQKLNFVKKITKAMGEDLSKYTISVLGLAFKGDTDDIRDSGAIKTTRLLRGYGAKLRVYDPAAMENSKKALGTDTIYYAKDEYDAVKETDALCIFTDWEQFKKLDLVKIKGLMRGDFLFDARNLLDQIAAEETGFVYIAVGKRTNGFIENGK